MIGKNVVFVKTSKGNEEIIQRTHKLNHGLRYVLILVNGKSTVGEILEKGAGLPAIDQALEYLATSGFIETISDTVSENKQTKRGAFSPRTEIIALAQAMLGAQATPVVKKFSEANDEPDALTQTATICKRLIKLAIDEKKADEFARRAQEIIFASKITRG